MHLLPLRAFRRTRSFALGSLSTIGVLLLQAAASTDRASAAPPMVVRATPDNADVDVDPALTELRVEFDQDMAPGGHSICGGKPQMPDFKGQGSWESPRVFVIPIALQADRRYDMSINCPAAQNFRSAAGEAAIPYPLSFRTAKAGAKSEPQSAEKNEAASDALRKAIDESYSYRDLRKVDWSKQFAAFDEQLRAAKSPSEFARATARLLSAAQDVHISVKVGEFTLGSHRRSYEANWNEKTLRKVVKQYKDVNNIIATGRLNDETGYILIRSWSADAKNAFDALPGVLDELRAMKNIVIDVRPNGGGDEMIARSFAVNFVAEPALYSKNSFCKPEKPGEFDKPIDRKIDPKDRNGEMYKGRVVVLMGPANLSSNESFLLMMRYGAKAKLVGQRSGGSSGNPKPHELGNGVTVFLPSWRDLLPDGSPLEGVGVEPDVTVDSTADDFAVNDPVIKTALKSLSEG